MTGRRSSSIRRSSSKASRRSSTKKRLSFVDKLHVCKKCETSFIRRSHLDIHMRTHIEEARRLSAIEAEMRQDDDASSHSQAVPDNVKKPSTGQESVTRRSLQNDDDGTKSQAKIATPQNKKARKSLAKDTINAPKSGHGKAFAKRAGSASLSMGWRCAKVKLSPRTTTIQGTAVTFYA